MSAIKNISLFIPHIYGNYTSSMVRDVFDDMGIGEVKNVDFVSKMGSDGKPYNAAYIHFYEWQDNVVARNFQERVLNPNKEARVMYDDPWYWIVLENKGKKHVPGQRKPTIDLDAFITPEKPVAPMLNFRPLNVHRAPKKNNSWSQSGQLHTPVNLENAFNSEAQYMDEEIDQEEIDRAFDHMEYEMETARMMSEMESEIEREDQCLISIDGRYVESIEEEIKILQRDITYFQNLYYAESIKYQALADIMKGGSNRPFGMV